MVAMSVLPRSAPQLRGLPPIWRESRIAGELAALRRDPVFFGAGVARGGGAPVLLVPGYLAGDASLGVMTGWLRRMDYRTSRAGMRFNTDCSTAAVERLEQRLERLADSRGGPVAIIGQSRGGSFARALAARRPELVSGIVCLGTPLLDPLAVHPLVKLNVRAMSRLGGIGIPGLFTRDCFDGECCATLRELLERPFPDDVGFVSIYSRSDGIVDWRACLEPGARAIDVDSSHCGMSVHADVYRVTARALRSFAVSAAAAAGVRAARAA
jgi:triacylglycerol lipase